MDVGVRAKKRVRNRIRRLSHHHGSSYFVSRSYSLRRSERNEHIDEMAQTKTCTVSKVVAKETPEMRHI